MGDAMLRRLIEDDVRSFAGTDRNVSEDDARSFGAADLEVIISDVVVEADEPELASAAVADGGEACKDETIKSWIREQFMEHGMLTQTALRAEFRLNQRRAKRLLELALSADELKVMAARRAVQASATLVSTPVATAAWKCLICLEE